MKKYQKVIIKTESEVVDENARKGCALFIVWIVPYLIVLFTVLKLVNLSIPSLSSTYNINVPEWIYSAAILITSGILFFCKKYIGKMALMSTAILIGIHYLF